MTLLSPPSDASSAFDASSRFDASPRFDSSRALDDSRGFDAPQGLDASSEFPRPPAARLGGASLGQRISADRFAGIIDDTWLVVRGPNGGFLAALLLDAMLQTASEPSRRPRVLSVHYPRVPAAGPIEIHTRVLRHGRSISWLSADLYQDGEVCVVARAALSEDWPSLEYSKLEPPTDLAPEQGMELSEGLPPFTHNFEYRSLFATPGGSDRHDCVGGYIRLREPRPHDEILLAALSDAWFPSTFAFDSRPVMAATLDLTVHFRDPAALDELAPREFLLSVFHSRLATAGFFEEDGAIWTRSGRLLAQSRQLAVAMPYGSPTTSTSS